MSKKEKCVTIELGEFRSLVTDVRLSLGVLEVVERMNYNITVLYAGETLVHETVDRLIEAVDIMDSILAKAEKQEAAV